MSGEMDGTDIAKLSGGVVGLGTVLWGAVKYLGGRQLKQYDEHIQHLTASITALSKTIQELREANIGLAKDIGAQTSATATNRERIDEATKFWREQLKEMTREHAEQMKEMSARLAELERRPYKGK